MTLQGYLVEYEQGHEHPLNQLTHIIGIPMIFISLFVVFFIPALGIVFFVLGWILQFVGHAIEGKKPKFFQGPIFVLIGLLWVFIKAWKMISRPFARS
jgi:uncharacterized membrane protein YGL010W